MKKRSYTFTLVLAILLTIDGHSQPNPCTTKEAHQFDFWLGEWDVYKYGTDTLVGHNLIKPLASGCALLENWNSIDNRSIGNSVNKYNFTTHKWQQMWVDNVGTTLLIEGEYNDSKMMLENEQPNLAGDGMVKNRITWYNNSDGTVRQLWQYSLDKGKTWLVAFDGLYKKIKN